MKFGNFFSQRNGLMPADTLVIRNSMPTDVQNAIANCFNVMWNQLDDARKQCHRCRDLTQEVIEREIWIHFLNQRIDTFSSRGQYRLASNLVISNDTYVWYRKLDLVEFVLRCLDHIIETAQFPLPEIDQIKQQFVKALNFEFSRLNYGYRVVDNEIIEITSESERKAINKAVEESKNNVKQHLKQAIMHYATRPEPDVRNSIKESISAVETVCRELTGESSLGAALKKLESKGLKVHDRLSAAFTQLYAYTNNPDTGIRHALMDDTGDYVPTAAEAYYMLVSCSAFINYLRMKSTAGH
jgi:hypothetical protein